MYIHLLNIKPWLTILNGSTYRINFKIKGQVPIYCEADKYGL